MTPGQILSLIITAAILAVAAFVLFRISGWLWRGPTRWFHAARERKALKYAEDFKRRERELEDSLRPK